MAERETERRMKTTPFDPLAYIHTKAAAFDLLWDALKTLHWGYIKIGIRAVRKSLQRGDPWRLK